MLHIARRLAILQESQRISCNNPWDSVKPVLEYAQVFLCPDILESQDIALSGPVVLDGDPGLAHSCAGCISNRQFLEEICIVFRRESGPAIPIICNYMFFLSDFPILSLKVFPYILRAISL